MADVVITIPNDIASAIEMLIDNEIEFIKPALMRQVLYVLAGKIPGPSDLSFTADPPLNYDVFNNKFTIGKATSLNDGFLSKEDFVIFKTGAPGYIIPTGKLLVFKVAGNTNELQKEIGDFCMGIVSDTFVNGNWNGGDEDDPESYQ